MRFIILLVLFNVNISSKFAQNGITTPDIIPKMLSSIESAKTLKYTLKNSERIDGKILSGIQDVKFNASPKKCYLYMMSPSKGAEVLFVEGQNDNKAMYDPNGFPYFKLNLDPLGFLMRRKNHHTIYEVGLGYMGEIIGHVFYANKQWLSYNGISKWKNNDCYKIIFDNPEFKYIPYIVKENENIISIARKFYLSEYMIVEINKDVDDYDDVKPNQKILIPNTYAKYMELYVDQKTYLPVFMKIIDDKGLYEQYEYTDFVVNSRIPDEEFTEKFLDKN